MKITEITSKTILSPSQIYDYVINPYVGCQHACTYCYARFMKRFSGHREPWGEFVDVKVNAPELLQKEIKRKKRGDVWISGVCDPYQPLEEKYRLTRQCLEILVRGNWPVFIQTRSPLVLRDLDIMTGATNLDVGLSITTANDEIRQLFEPGAPSIEKRLTTLGELHRHHLRTYVMIAPILPEAEGIVQRVADTVDYVIVDRMNYHYADWVYSKYGLGEKRYDEFFRRAGRRIEEECKRLGLDCRVVY